MPKRLIPKNNIKPIGIDITTDNHIGKPVKYFKKPKQLIMQSNFAAIKTPVNAGFEKRFAQVF